MVVPREVLNAPRKCGLYFSAVALCTCTAWAPVMNNPRNGFLRPGSYWHAMLQVHVVWLERTQLGLSSSNCIPWLSQHAQAVVRHGQSLSVRIEMTAA